LPARLHHLQSFHHLIVTPKSRSLHRQIARLQGSAGLWVVGMYAMDVDNHESALASALPVARALGEATEAGRVKGRAVA
jgi:predicted NAD/FAD-binding protein